MARVARVVLKCVDKDAAAVEPMTLDLVLEDDGQVIKKIPTFGWWGTLKPAEELDPFIFFPSDGRLHFGNSWEDTNRRLGRTNIADKQIVVGEYVTVAYLNREHCFVIKQLVWWNELLAELVETATMEKLAKSRKKQIKKQMKKQTWKD